MAVAATGLAAGFGGLPAPVSAALLAGLAPGVAAAWLLYRDTPKNRSLLLALWAIAGGLAAILAGGISGPLAVWCLAPVAAAAVLGGSSLLARASAMSLLAAALAAIAELAGLAHASASTFDFWLGLLALSTTGAGLGTGLLLARAHGRRRETAQAESAAELHSLLADQPQLMILSRDGGWITGLFGTTPTSLAGAPLRDRNLVELAVEADRPLVQAAIREAATAGRASVLFTPQLMSEGRLALDLRLRRDGRMIGTLRDDSVAREKEAALQSAKADAESLAAGRARFLANMSHELRTPLNAIMGFSDIMRARMFGELPGKYVEYADLIHESGRHLLDLINDVLDMSKIEAHRYELTREILDAREPVAAALRILRLQADDVGVQLRGVLPPRPLDIDADRRALKQIAINLVSNALKFTPRGGLVTVTAQERGEAFELVVADNGVGIAAEDVEKLGRPYEQVGDNDKRTMGTGLGLSLVRAFAELHGGVMSVESRLGEGTAVTVRLPVLVPPQADPAPVLETADNVVAFTPQR